MEQIADREQSIPSYINDRGSNRAIELENLFVERKFRIRLAPDARRQGCELNDCSTVLLREFRMTDDVADAR